MGISKIGPREFLICARVLLQDPDPTKPRQDRRRRERFKGTYAQAEERYLAMKADLRGERPQVKARTFGDLLRLYEESRGGALPGTQISTYKAVLEDLGAVEIKALPAALRQYSILLRKMPTKRSGKHLANGTINRYRALICTALNLAKDLKIIPESPLNKAVWPKLKEIPRDRILTPEEQERLFATIAERTPHLLPVVRFASMVPCRKMELVRMTKADLDLFNNAIRVNNGTTKNEEGTWKPIPPDLVPYFRSIPAECPYLFYRFHAGEYHALGDFHPSWRRCLEAAGIKNFRFHDTRHISATNLVNAGTPERVVMAVAGWKTNMLSTYWKNLGQGNLALVRFPSGSGTQVATSEKAGAENGDSRAERAVL